MRWIFLSLLMANLLLVVLVFQAGSEESEIRGNKPVGQLDVMPLSRYKQIDGEPGTGINQTNPSSNPGAGSETASRCSSLGPLPEKSRAQALSAELASYGLASEIRSESIDTINDYWVIQTPQVTAGHQGEDIARLRRSGIEDVSPIRGGPQDGGISLGIYKQKADAIQRRQQVDRYGLTAEIVERGEKQSVFWVDASIDISKSMSPNLVESITARYLPITINTIDCR